MPLTLPGKIETDRLLLRPCEARDRDAFLAFMADERATRHLAFAAEQRTPEGAGVMFDAVVASYDGEQPIFVLTVATREDDAYVGSVGLSPLEEENGVAECFYTIVPTHWGKGYATEATLALVRHGLETCGLRRIEAHVSHANPASAAVAERCGFEQREELAATELRAAGTRYVVEALG